MPDSSDVQPNPPEVRPYDFRRPYRASVKLIASVEPLMNDFAVAMTKAICEQLRCECDISPRFVEAVRYEDFLYSLNETTCLSVLRFEPPGAQGIIDFPLAVIYPMIDRLLGGRGHSQTPIPHRPLTQIEQSLALQIIERTAGGLADTLNRFGSRVAPLSVREESLERSPASVRIMPTDEIVVAGRFDVRFGENGAMGICGDGTTRTISLCVPTPVVEYIRQAPVPRSIEQRERATGDMTRNILDASVELRALLAQTKLRLSDVLTMQAGDVITTDAPVGRIDDEVSMTIEGQEKFIGRLGHVQGARSVRITRMAEDSQGSGDVT